MRKFILLIIMNFIFFFKFSKSLKKSFESACQTETKKSNNVIKNLKNFDELFKKWNLDPKLMIDIDNDVILLKSVEKDEFI